MNIKSVTAGISVFVLPALLSAAASAAMAAQDTSVPAVRPLAADFDGDGKADPALANTNGTWQIKLSTANYAPTALSGFPGGSGAAALAADFDGDCLADPAVYSAAQRLWAVTLSSLHYPSNPTIIRDFGGNDWQAVAGDFDGDRQADPALYNTNGTWQVKLSSSGYATTTRIGLLGLPGWTPMAADFDGDGKADPAIYQDLAGAWIVLLSADNYRPVITPTGYLGSSDYAGLAADFDGDAYADPAVAQTCTGNWRLRLSGSSYAATSRDNFLGEDVPALTLQRVSNLYYRVEANLPAVSHYAIGRQYGLQIQNSVTNFAAEVDAGLNAMFALLKEADDTLTFAQLIERAQTILTNVPSAYQEEIRGMQSVFSSPDDTPGNGKLSPNKVLLYQLVADVMRSHSCSASAAFGAATDTGKTILGRNLEWLDVTLGNQARMHTVTILRNGGRSLVLFGFLGQFQVTSAFSASGIFASILDSNVGAPYEISGDKRSYPLDLRYALETRTNLQDIAAYFDGKGYAFNFNLFLADAERAAVLEVDIHTPFSGLRTATSPLKTDAAKPILPWNFSNAIACVNWFTLPGTIDNSDLWGGNATRWDSYLDLYRQHLDQGKITMDAMKLITGYPGANHDGKAINGAIWRYEDGEDAGGALSESEVQSIVMDMGTFETWVSFQPVGQPALRSPNYVQVFSGNPF